MERLKKLVHLDSGGYVRIRGPFLIAVGFIVLFALFSIPPAWEYSNSASFCGTTCHTMPPEYQTYLVSPHARVLCVDCHIGRDLIAVQFTRKIGHTRLVFATVLDEFDYPIHSGEMRPARETCERCHTPEKFSNDSVRIIRRSENNRTNDPYEIYLMMHVGGGSEREGLGRGIHWHIENTITYIATDKREQEIPWVRVTAPDGTITDYNAINSPIDTSNLSQYTLHKMDCITCHNRIAHLIETPTNAVDTALFLGDISRDIPFIRTRAIELLTPLYATSDEAKRAFASLDGYYADNYPEFYAEGQDLVQEAIKRLEKLYDDANYPQQLLTWQTHPNNVGHSDSPGCFRCHDGQHFSTTGEAIRLECNLCHSIPQVVLPTDIEPKIPISTGIEPASHLTTTWISQHHNEFDASCANCHTTQNPGGIDNSSFCSNSACHGSGWDYAGFNAPGLATIMGIYQVRPAPLLEDFEGEPTFAILKPLFDLECAACHGAVPSKGLRITDYASLLAGSEAGAVVVANSVEESKIVQVLIDGHFGQFTAHQLDLLRQWIMNGLPEG